MTVLEEALGKQFPRMTIGLLSGVRTFDRVGVEIRAVLEGNAFSEESGDWLEVSGRDSRRFLNGLVTCDLQRLEPGHLTYGFFANPKGRVLADGLFLAVEDAFRIKLPAGGSQLIREHAEKYLVADDVNIENLGNYSALRVIADQVPSKASLDGVTASRMDVPVGLGVGSWLVSGDRDAMVSTAGALLEVGLRPFGLEALTCLRVERGAPVFGLDFDSRHFPQESGLERWAVNYQKGCYLGQEVVARIHFRGKVNRRLVGLRFHLGREDGSGLIEAIGSPLFHGEEEVGSLGSSCWSAEVGEWIGLAVIHNKAVTRSSVVVRESDSTEFVGELVDLPFEPAKSR